MTETDVQGPRVVLTRAAAQAEPLAARLRAAGARVELLPLIEVVPPADPAPLAAALAELGSFDFLAFTSANAVQALFQHLPEPPARFPRLAAVGPATAEALGARGLAPSLVARQSRGAGLAEELAAEMERGERVLVPQAADARPDLVAGLRAQGIDVVAVVAYDKALPAAAPARARELFVASPLGWVTFTSPRIVRHFLALLGADWPRRRGELRALSIGPTTSAELRRHGIEPAAEAPSPTPEAMAQALVRTRGNL